MTHQAAAVVLDVLLVQHVRANLTSPLNFLLLAPGLHFRVFALFAFTVKKALFENLESHFAVLDLASSNLNGYHHTRGQVSHPHCAVGGVHALSACALRAVHVHPHLGVQNLNVNFLFGHFRDHLETGKAGLTAVVAVERRGPHQTVNPVFWQHHPVSAFPPNYKLCARDAGLLAFLNVQNIHLKAAALGPANVCSEQHIGPVLRLGATRPALDHYDGGGLGVLHGKQGFAVEEVDILLEPSLLTG